MSSYNLKHMKYIIYLITIATVLFVGCNKHDQEPTDSTNGGYIFFSKGLTTKATLLGSDDMINQFGVVGYKYDNSIEWADELNNDPQPTIFGNNIPQVVNMDEDGDPIYSPLQGWTNTKRYSFFAFYPLGYSNVTLVDLDGNEYTAQSTGTPAIKYSMNVNSPTSSMVDVMIASAIDKHWNSLTDNNLSNGNVALTFDHCLSSLGLKVKNTSSGPIKLKSVVLKVAGIMYKDIIISLDGDEDKNTTVASGIADNTVDLTLSTTAEAAIASGHEKELNDKLLFIPQPNNVSVQVAVEYEREANNGYSGISYSTLIPDTEALTTGLTKGTKHLIHLNFAESTVTATIGTGAWNDSIIVDSTFN